MTRKHELSASTQADCPACEESYICRQGEGCLLVEVIDQADARSAETRQPIPASPPQDRTA